MKAQEKAALPDFGLYVHVPFCARSCDFCHFYQEAPRRADLEAYLDGMESALERFAPPRPAGTVFFGGGTPGLLPARDLERLCRAVLRAQGGLPPAEWTVEMAPATLKADKLQVLRDHGVNRISIGVQSFNPELLAALGRIHSIRQVREAIRLLEKADFPNFNLDLIFAIPGQELSMWKEDLEEAVRSAPAHISTYCLTFEEDTALWLRLQQGTVRRRDPDEEAVFFELAAEVLEGSGFAQYEVSNYARPAHACLHNINTWRMQEWIGYGPSAASQLGMRRWTEPHSLEDWMEGVRTGKRRFVEEVSLTPSILAQDFLVFGLRMNAGVDLAELEKRFPGAVPEGWEELKSGLIAEGLGLQEGKRFRLTTAGRLVADRIGEEILARSGAL
ncbi:MAG: radical SAM family heme chaperone HemW [Oceanipulchritudo sp.]